MLSELLYALSVHLGDPPPYGKGSFFGEYTQAYFDHVSLPLGKERFSMVKIRFYHRISKNFDNKCDPLVVYLGDYNKEKWLNSFLKDWNYNQFDEAKDEYSRNNFESFSSNNYFVVFLEGRGRKITDCIYYVDAVDGIYQKDRTVIFRFGYYPLQNEPIFWWNMEK